MKPAVSALLALSVLAALMVLSATSNRAQEPSATKPHYNVTDLGTLGGVASSAHSINNRVWVAGVANVAGDTAEHASLWRHGLLTDLGTLGGLNSNVDFPVKNDSGLIAGFAQTSTPDPLGEQVCTFSCTLSGGACEGSNLTCRGFLWQNNVLKPLGTLGGNNSVATGVNDLGLVVGLAENTTKDPDCVPPQVLDYEAVTWNPHGKIHELPAFSGDAIAAAIAVNDRGQVAGGSGSCGSGPGISPIFVHALLWQHGSVTDLGSLGGKINNVAYATNNSSEIVGASDLAGDNTVHAFLWQYGMMTDLGTLAGDFSSTAYGINGEGQVVGQSCDQSANCRAFLWQNGVMTDLNTLIAPSSSLFLIYAADINDRGEIAGVAFDQGTGQMPAFLATPSNDTWNTTSAAGETTQATRITLPENVRKLLHQRLGLRRSGAWPVRPQ
jgi:probable HAF family extracellular repeat protein